VRLSRPLTLVPAVFSLCLGALTLASPALAKPWQGITPGVSNNMDVVGKFGEPTKTLTEKDKQTLVYSRDNAIKGTVQSQFKVNSLKVVERIDVFPAVTLDVAAIEKSYGPKCDAKASNEPCFVEKQSPSKARYYVYAKLGLAVFFKDDGKTVKQLVFLPPA
jgi:hypothetical protein